MGAPVFFSVRCQTKHFAAELENLVHYAATFLLRLFEETERENGAK
jgi:hypothetical protein